MQREDPDKPPFKSGDRVSRKEGENPFATWHEASKKIIVQGGVCVIRLIHYNEKLGKWIFTIEGRGELGEFFAHQFEKAWGYST